MSNQSLGNLTVNLVAETGSYEEGMDRAQRATENLEKATKKQAAELDKLRYAIDPLAGQLAKVEKQQQALNKAFADSRVSADEYKKLNDKLEQTRRGLNGLGKEMKQSGMSAAQLAFATRQLPAQFTDIFTSLASGQSPMTVLIQQGGQLKDTFGGIGPAAEAMGGYIKGLINPVSVLAASAAVLGTVFYLGSEEFDRFNEAVNLTGGSSGITAEELAVLAKKIDTVTSTTAKASEALALIAGSGKFAKEQFDDIAYAALMLESATGRAVSETVKEFERLAESPSAAALELNKNYHYLTQAVYEQITALERQGKTTEAAELSVKTYSDVVRDRSSAIVENIGSIEAAWRGVKSLSKEAVDSLLNIGRDETDIERLQKLRQQISRLSAGAAYAERGDYAGGSLKQLQAEEAALAKKVESEKKIAEQKAQQAKSQSDAIAAQQAIQRLSESALTNEEKRTKAIADYQANIEKIRAVNPNSDLLNKDKIAKDLANINSQYADKSAPAAVKDSSAERLLLTLKQQQEVLQAQVGSVERLGTNAAKLIAFEQEIADLKDKKTLTAEQKSLLASEGVIRAQLEKNAAIEKQIELQKQVARTLEVERSLRDQLSREQQSYNDRLEAFGKGDKALDKLRERQQIERDFQRQLEQLNDQKSRGDIGADQYTTELELLQDSLEERLKLYEDYYARQEEMQADWTVGANRALENYIENAKNIAGMTEDIIGNAFSGLEDVIYDFVATGEMKLGDLMRSIGQEVIRMLIRIGVQKTASFLLDKALGTAAATGYVAQVTGQAYAGMNLAAINAFASTAAIPIVGPLAAPAAAGAALAFTSPFVGAAITSATSTLAGMAHSGIDNIPSEGTWLLDRGERVLSPRQNQDLTQFLATQPSSRNGPVEVSINLSAVRDDELLRMLSGKRSEIAGMVAAALADAGITLG
ncbi:MAG TPA: phage tail tape measure protein [Rheinheimera sp.]|nr:phage tail tape measure protein [Rheinheimera sp.]